MTLIRHINHVEPLITSDIPGAVARYFRSRGLYVDQRDEAEIMARILGHADERAHREHQRNAERLYAFRADLADYDVKGKFSGKGTLATPVLQEGLDLEQMQEFAEKESASSQWAVVVVDGNGELQFTADDFFGYPALMVGVTQGAILNENAELRQDLAEAVVSLENNLEGLTEGAFHVAMARAYYRKQAVPGEASQPGILFIAHEETGKIFWRQPV